MKQYPFFDLQRVNRPLLPMLVISGLLTIAGFSHGIYSLLSIADADPVASLTALSADDQAMLQTDGYLRIGQISATLVALTFFFTAWLYFAARNLVAIYAERHQTVANSLIIYTKVTLGIFFALRMMLSMWRRSTPDSHAHEAEKWLIPVWWLILIAANVCKIISVYTLQSASEVGTWSASYSWMIAAYCLYFPLYFLTWRLAMAMTRFQGLSWDKRQQELDEIFGEAFHVGGRGEKRRWRDPYPCAPDALSLLWRNLKGPSTANPQAVNYPASKTLVANDITPELTVGFGGDVMMMFGRELTASDGVKAFFEGCDSIVLNMEGVVTDKPKKGPDQKHDHAIMDQLATIFPADKTWLSLANNHAADFGADECLKSAELLHNKGFRTFGLKDAPYADVHPALRIIGGTQWSNRDDKGVLNWLDERPEQHRRDGSFNMLMPHWGYEMECFPRTWGVNMMQQWLQQFDGVIGHHSHTPQPLTLIEQDGVNAVAGYSLGGFCFGLSKRNAMGLMHYGYGMIAKVTIGRLKSNPDQYAIGEVQWQLIECFPDEAKTAWQIDLIDDLPYFSK
ncbi:MAG: hypothetical protein CSH37_07655 [Thalassolituus sp.]|nr:MAG: hypothetical protein CSH37_07655 [Thalassolituus sp.]